MKSILIPENFEVPKVLENLKLRLRMLSVNDVVKDYDAVMTSLDHIHGVFGPNHRWPTKELTFEQDLIDLGWHQKEFQKKSSFAYTVMNLDESQCLGCVYIYPSSKKDYNAEIYLWVRQSEVANGLDEFLFSTVKKWVKDKWSLNEVAYPGREINWDEWASLR